MAVQWFNPYYVFGGEGGSGTGKVFTKTENGLVPAPGASARDDLVLRADGTWGQGGGGSATVGLGKQSAQATWPAVYKAVSSTPLNNSTWDFKDPEDFYRELQSLQGYALRGNDYPDQHDAVNYFKEYLKDDEVKEGILKFVEFCHSISYAVYGAWASSTTSDSRNAFRLYAVNVLNNTYYPATGYNNNKAFRTTVTAPNWSYSLAENFNAANISIPESAGITLPIDGVETPIKSTNLLFSVTSDGVGLIQGSGASDVSASLMDLQYPAPDPGDGQLAYTPNYVGGVLSSNISGYNNYGTLHSIKYDSGKLTFVNTQNAAVISIPNATATGENELTLNDLQKIVYNEATSPKQLEIYDKTGTLRFTVNDTSSGTSGETSNTDDLKIHVGDDGVKTNG